MVLLLLLSITPKSFLHEMLARHQDTPSCSDTMLEGPCIHKQGYSCQQSDLVVPSVYLMSESNELIHHRDYCIVDKIFSGSSLIKTFPIRLHDRAPPARL